MEPNQTLAGLTSRLVERCDRAARRARRPTWCSCRATPPPCSAPPWPASTAASRSATSKPACAPATSPRRFPRRPTAGWSSPLVDLHFAPTETARQALLAERIPERAHPRHRQHGDRRPAHGARAGSSSPRCEAPCTPSSPASSAQDWHARPVVLVTGHRRENFGAGFEEICTALDELAPQSARAADRLPRAPQPAREGGRPRPPRGRARTSASSRRSPTPSSWRWRRRAG